MILIDDYKQAREKLRVYECTSKLDTGNSDEKRDRSRAKRQRSYLLPGEVEECNSERDRDVDEGKRKITHKQNESCSKTVSISSVKRYRGTYIFLCM